MSGITGLIVSSALVALNGYMIFTSEELVIELLGIVAIYCFAAVHGMRIHRSLATEESP